MKRINNTMDAYIDCEKWAETLNTRYSYNSELNSPNRIPRNSTYENYTEFSTELTNVRRLVSARVYEELYSITKAPRLYGSWNMRGLATEIGVNESKMTRLREPDEGTPTVVGPYELLINGIDAGKQVNRKVPEGFYVSVEGLYKLAYFFLDRSCEKVLFGDECAPIHLPNIYSCLFTQISAMPYAESREIQSEIQANCEAKDRYMIKGTADGFKENNFVYRNSKGAPVDFQELYIKRLKEKMEDDCSTAVTLFGTEANSQLRIYSDRCYNVTNEAIAAADKAIFCDIAGEPLKPKKKKKEEKEPLGTTGNLMILSIGLNMAVDYFVAPDYTKYNTILVRTNTPDAEKRTKEVKLDDNARKTLSALLMVENGEERDEIISDALCDCWVSQYEYELKNS